MAITAVLIAAKIEQPFSPNFQRMINILPFDQQLVIKKNDLVKLEHDVVKTL